MRNRRQSGYSLAEMLTVIAIIGALALVTIPAFMTYMQSNKMKSSLRQLTGDLRRARARAIGQGQQVMVTFGTGSGARTYDVYQGNAPFNSTSWSRPSTPVSLQSTRAMDSTVYFPSTSGTQTFPDTVTCATLPCTAGTDSKPDVIFFPDGRVSIPSGSTFGLVTVQTDMKIPKPVYAITISPSGRTVALESLAFAKLGAPGDGAVVFCNDCTNATGGTCASGGNGAVATRTGGAWACN